MKVLLLSSSFFGYSQRVANAIRETNNEVDEVYSYSIPYYMRVLRKLRINIYERAIKKYYTQKIAAIGGKEYDKIIVFGGGTPLFVIKTLKQHYKDSEFTLYLSADLSSYGFSNEYLALFDRKLSYSLFDAEKYGFDYTPWFYSDKKYSEKDIDISFIGTIHPIRLNYLMSFKSCKSLKCFFYIYSERLSYIRYFIKWQSLKQYTHFKGLSYDEYISVLSRSKATLDIPEKGQNNITTRPIEALATDTKIITTNNNIKKYDFYNKNNILIINDLKDMNKIIDWLEIPISRANHTILNNYSIDTFIKHLLNN
jgi:hypothetical protein